MASGERGPARSSSEAVDARRHPGGRRPMVEGAEGAGDRRASGARRSVAGGWVRRGSVACQGVTTEVAADKRGSGAAKVPSREWRSGRGGDDIGDRRRFG
jgi:hypothetical protein